MPQGKLLTVMYILTDSIKLDLQEVELKGVDWSFVVEGRDQSLACRNMKILLLVA